MNQTSVNTLIKTLRKNNGISQEKLSEGLCSRDELSRIERGVRRPHWWLFEQLLQRLGEDSQRYYAVYNSIFTQEDMRIMNLREQLKHLLRDKRNIDEVTELLITLEQDDAFKKGINLQLLLKSKSTLAFYCHDYNTMQAYVLEALKLTKPKFDESDIDSYILLTHDETWLIQQLAIAYSFTDSIEKSTDILLKLKIALDKGYATTDENIKTYSAILYNLTKNLGILGKFENCIDLCDQGIAFCKKNRDAYLRPMFMYNKACCLLDIEETSAAIELAKQVITLFTIDERFDEIAKVQAYFEDKLKSKDIFM